MVATILVTTVCISVTSVLANSYRWKDENGKVHYGAAVPAEYSDQPYDVLNNAGQVIKHVERTTTPKEVWVEEETKTKAPLISNEERQIQTDRLLVIQYKSEEEIQTALEHELAQLGHDTKLIRQSQESTASTIREQIRMAANQQRANLEIKADQAEVIRKLYTRREMDEGKLEAVKKRGDRIRERFQEKLERYRYLTAKNKAINEAQTDQG